MNTTTKVGTCGFTDAKNEYARHFSCVEVQQTFYQPPRTATLEQWRTQVPADFEFTMKAWQLITHQAKSPTYKRLTVTLSEQERAEAGFFKPTAIVNQAWQITLASAKALRATTILFQCPASFTQTAEHIGHLTDFFSHIERSGLRLCWEPRGSWDPTVVRDLCRDLDLWHVVDPFAQATTTPEHCYFRLHGRQGWRYRYEVQELTDLVELLPPDQPSYVLFNNVHMRQDALVLKGLLDAAP